MTLIAQLKMKKTILIEKSWWWPFSKCSTKPNENFCEHKMTEMEIIRNCSCSYGLGIDKLVSAISYSTYDMHIIMFICSISYGPYDMVRISQVLISYKDCFIQRLIKQVFENAILQSGLITETF